MNDMDSFELKSNEFPKIFRKTFSDRFEKRFSSILISSTFVHVLMVLYFLANPISQERTLSRNSRIQERLAKTLMERQKELALESTQFEFLGDRRVKKEEKKKEETAAKKADSKKKSSTEAPKKQVASNTKPRRGAAGRKSRTTQEIKASIGTKGLLGLLTSTSTVARGSEVEDILVNTVQSQKDLDEALSNLSGITASGGNNQGYGNSRANVKGGRSGSGGGIDDLVGGLGKTQSNSIERTGTLVVMNETPLIEDSGNKGIKGRSQESVQGVVLKHNKSIQYCYERELKRNPTLKGKIAIRFTITPQGTIKKVSIVTSTLNNRKIEQCVLSRVRRWSDFGAIDLTIGDTTIRQVYAFGY